MSGIGQPYGQGFFSPEDMATESGIRRRQAYANALLQSDAPTGAYGGLAAAGNKLLGAFLANRADKQEQDLATSAGQRRMAAYATLMGNPQGTQNTGGGVAGSTPTPQALGGALSGAPQSAATDPEGNPMGSFSPAPSPIPNATGPAPAPSPVPNASGPAPMPTPMGGGQAQPPLTSGRMGGTSEPGLTGGNPQAPQSVPGTQGQMMPLSQRILATGDYGLISQMLPAALQHEQEISEGRSEKLWENSLPMSTAAQQQSGLQLQNQEALADYNNKLPMTAEQVASNRIAQQNANAATTSANKPVFAPYGAPGYFQGGKYTAMPGTASAFGDGDSKSPSLQGQLGLSSMGINYLAGNTSQMGMRDKAMASKEVDNMVARTGLDMSVIKPKIQAYQSAVQMNTLKANTMDTLSREMQGTIANLSPIADKIGGNVRFVNGIATLIGGAVNDPDAQKYVTYLNQLRADLAGFNAASGGKIGVHGQVGTDNQDFQNAERVIQNGLSSGGARALGQAIESTRQKNVAIVQQQSDEAQRGIWNAFGIGKNFDATHPGTTPMPQAANNSGGGNSKFTEGQTYIDAHGNKAKYQNGQFVPVQ